MNPASRTSLGFLLTGLLGALVGALVVACASAKILNSAAGDRSYQMASAAPLHGSSSDLEQRLIDTVKRTDPSVVLIQSTVHGQQIISPFANDPFFRQFFGDQAPGVSQPFTARASGSGFILKRNGDSAIIATNAHVIYRADKVQVLLSTGRKVQADVVGSDIRTDLALLRIRGSNLPPALPVGNSSALQQGQFVLAIGEPEEFRNSVSFGIVSALHRNNIIAGDPQSNIPAIHYSDMIQTTAPINPGNSGGPLLTDEGQVVGITAVVAHNAQALGFAIPMNAAQPVLAQLEQHRSIAHPYMGILMRPLTPQIAHYLGYVDKTGVVVDSVVQDSPAAHAGLQQGDIIVELNHKKVNDQDQIRRTISALHVGDRVSVLVWRNGNLQPYDVTLQNEPENLGQG